MKNQVSLFTMLFILISSIAFSQQAKEFNLPPKAKFMPKLYQEIDYSYKLNDLSLNEAVTKNFLNRFTETDLDKLKKKDNITYNYYKAAQNYFRSLSDTVKKKFTVEELWHVYIYDQKLKNKLKTIN
ncbi:MAG: hypothetical protein COA88_13535 [Kordia sp.]|nr:MAG: hypothetical protein COA88_13535 [Kordia sp.]